MTPGWIALFWFHVAGLAETKGSWRGIGRGRMRPDNPREESWAALVAWSAKAAMLRAGHVVDKRRYSVEIDFVLPAPRGMRNRRDIDKMIRSVLDAMTKLVWIDDEQVDQIIASKRVGQTGQTIGATIRVATIRVAVAA